MRLLILTLALAAGPAEAKDMSVPKGFELLELKDGRFRAQVPAWEKSRDKAEDKRQKIHGVTLAAPAEDEGPRVSIELEHYAPGNPHFKDAEAYLAQQTAPSEFKVRGRLVGKPAPIKVGKSKARHWFRESMQTLPPDSPQGKTFEMKSEVVLIGAEAGFYVLTYTAPKKRFLKSRKAFQRVLVTFELISPE